jgi:hypothetical protein
VIDLLLDFEISLTVSLFSFAGSIGRSEFSVRDGTQECIDENVSESRRVDNARYRPVWHNVGA